MFTLKKLSSLPLQSALRRSVFDFLKFNEGYCGLLVGNLFLNGDSIKEGQIYSGDYKVFVSDECKQSNEFNQVGGVYCHFVAGNLLFQFNPQIDEHVKKSLIDQMIQETLQDGIQLTG
ncbi:predicted protein [Naegleria gruberi]|uniref:Predicted protein n=1 Tax=Naegleria gruberi TaxID=5762 RepID=D2VQ82_NAEGR|nr:uncharacterized protein NAEGRDRAFT_71057 [Naegleria gruberi]EFC41000.1 predicted protein [Naegleria gruberi]|eukprot:XP_002673744.1 predicted protein [Naegleria gruberi strain NEG-M]